MKKSKEDLVIRLISATKKKLRPFNLVEIAQDILELKRIVGNLKQVSILIGISVDMLNQFLTVFKLQPKILTLVKNRTIDSVSIVRYLNSFKKEDQYELVNFIVKGSLNSQDLRALSPLRKRFESLPLERVIDKLKKSQDKKIYLFYFYVKSRIHFKGIINKLNKLIGNKQIVEYSIKGKNCSLAITREGLQKIHSLAKSEKTTLRKYFKKIVES